MENTNNIKDLIQKFYPYAKNALGFEHPVRVIMRKDAENAENPLGKTAYYDPEQKLIVLYVINRHPKDVLRSFSHELVHHAQNCRGDLDDMTTQGHYAKDGKGREIEKEAYLQGNLCLRDYEDQKKFTGENQMNEHYSIAKEEFKKIFAETVKAVLDEKKNKKKKKEFPDLTGDGKVTKADILKGRGVDLDEGTDADEEASLKEANCEEVIKKVSDLERQANQAFRDSRGNDMAHAVGSQAEAEARDLREKHKNCFPEYSKDNVEESNINESRKTLEVAYKEMVKDVQFNKDYLEDSAKIELGKATKKLDKLAGDLFGNAKTYSYPGYPDRTFSYPNTPEQMQRDGLPLDPAKMQKYAKGVEKIKAELEEELRDIIEQDKKPPEYPVHTKGEKPTYPGHDDPDRGRNFDALGNPIKRRYQESKQEEKQVVTETPQQTKEIKETDKTWYNTSLYSKLVSRWTKKGDK
jgi:hypothetical protein